ncbi:hypothetical protein [Nocardioides pacificus]
MPTHASTHLQVRIGEHVVSRHGISVFEDRVCVRFEVRGPESDMRFIEDHVAAYRPDGPDSGDKLDGLGGSGGDCADEGSYFVWEWKWSGEEQIVLRYFDAGSLLAEERVVVPPVGTDAHAVAALHDGPSFLTFRS